ncbi:MAG: hypothetical protein KAY24_09700 [Candidatus Eisenbacteria sp.]|nr:hypothetical protein [Candidatus Eisenbacteria bacterium]
MGLGGWLSHVVFATVLTLAYLGALTRLRRQDERLLRAGLVVLAAKVLFVLAFVLIWPDRIVHKDAGRYFHEMQLIAQYPWLWNPLTGHGPGYHASAKLGMSYVYGWLFWLFHVRSIAAALMLNVFFACLTSLAVYHLTHRIGESRKLAVSAMLLSAIYPETLYWSGRILRENFTLLLVPCLFLSMLALFEKPTVRRSVAFALLSVTVVATRVQLILFVPLILLMFLFVGRQRAWKKACYVLAFLAPICLAAPFVGYLLDQTVCNQGGQYLACDPSFWSGKLLAGIMNLPLVLSLVPKMGHGPEGYLMLPFTVWLFAMLAMMVFRFKAVFRRRTREALLLFVPCAIYLWMLAMQDAINIRYRVSVMPVLLPLGVVSCSHFWGQWKARWMTRRRSSPG